MSTQCKEDWHVCSTLTGKNNTMEHDEFFWIFLYPYCLKNVLQTSSSGTIWSLCRSRPTWSVPAHYDPSWFMGTVNLEQLWANQQIPVRDRGEVLGTQWTRSQGSHEWLDHHHKHGKTPLENRAVLSPGLNNQDTCHNLGHSALINCSQRLGPSRLSPTFKLHIFPKKYLSIPLPFPNWIFLK